MPYQISSFRINRYNQRRDKCQYHHQLLLDDDNDMVLFSGKQSSKPILEVKLEYPSSNDNLPTYDQNCTDDHEHHSKLDFCLDDENETSTPYEIETYWRIERLVEQLCCLLPSFA